MHCTDYKRWFSPYVDGLLPPDERAQLEAHLRDCAGCRADLTGLQEMLQSLRAMGQVEVPELLPGIHARLQAEPWWHRVAQRFFAPWPASLPLHGLAMAATAILVVIVVGLPSVFQGRTMAPEKYRLASARKNQPERAAKVQERQDAVVFQYQLTAPGAGWDGRTNGDESTYRGRDKETAANLAALPSAPEDAKPSSLLGRAVAALAEQPTGEISKMIGGGTAFSGTGSEGGRYVLNRSEIATSQKTEELDQIAAPPVIVQWHVNHVPTAATEVADWVRAHHGSLIPIDDRHLTIQLAGADVSEFMQRFSDSAATPQAQPPAEQAKDASPISRVTISLELVPSE